jgi:hypothetical protein
MKWITRERVKVDRAACPWLIRKFIDPEAVFLFVPAEGVMSKAAELGRRRSMWKGVSWGTMEKTCLSIPSSRNTS